MVKLNPQEGRGLGSIVSRSTEYTTGMKTPGAFNDALNFIYAPVSPYNIPLSEDKRLETIQNLKNFSKENQQSEYGRYVDNIAKELEKKDEFGVYYNQSLIGASSKVGLGRDRLEEIIRNAEANTNHSKTPSSSFRPTSSLHLANTQKHQLGG